MDKTIDHHVRFVAFQREYLVTCLAWPYSPIAAIMIRYGGNVIEKKIIIRRVANSDLARYVIISVAIRQTTLYKHFGQRRTQSKASRGPSRKHT